MHITNAISHLGRLSLLLLGCFLIVGCGGGDTGTVSGTVTVDGQPTDALEVEFIPVDVENGPAMGYTSQGGKYQLIQGRGNKQIPVGDYRVAISVFGEAATPEVKALKLPPTYTSAEETELQATIKSGANTIDFDLQTQ